MDDSPTSFHHFAEEKLRIRIQRAVPVAQLELRLAFVQCHFHAFRNAGQKLIVHTAQLLLLFVQKVDSFAKVLHAVRWQIQDMLIVSRYTEMPRRRREDSIKLEE